MNTRNLRFTYLQTNSSVDMHNLARVTGPSALATRAVAGAVILAGAIPPQMQAAVGKGGNTMD